MITMTVSPRVLRIRVGPPDTTEVDPPGMLTVMVVPQGVPLLTQQVGSEDVGRVMAWGTVKQCAQPQFE